MMFYTRFLFKGVSPFESKEKDKMSDYTPDNWVILKIQNESKTLYKVLAGWSGGYLYGDSWRMNSGITEVKQGGDHYEFYGLSGSVYRCHKDTYRLTMANGGVYNELKERFGDSIELMPEDTNWMEIDW